MKNYYDKDFEVGILVGGLGTRLRNLIKFMPKALAPINKMPFLDLILDHLINEEIIEVNLLVGYKANIIKSHYGNKYKNLKIKYSLENTPLGTGGAIKKFAKSTNSKYLLILNGDTYFPFNLKKYLKSIPDDKQSLICTKIKDSSRYGFLEINKNNTLEGFQEKKSKKNVPINAGVYFIDKSKIIDFPEISFSLEKEYFQDLLIKKEEIYVHYDNAYFIDIGIPKDYKKALEYFKNENC